MAEVAQLEVGIIAKLDKFDLTLNQAQNQLKQLGKAAGDVAKNDISAFNIKIKELSDYIKALKKEGLPDIAYKLGDDLNKLNPTLDQTNALIKKFKEQAGGASQKELPSLNKEILKLQTYANGLQKLGLPNNLPDNAKRSTIALTSLNQVVQDLPFGFIGIQNNIPNLVQSFNELVKTEGGLRNALLSLGRTILGPAGLLFGVSALASGATFLIQKYGSLDQAAKILFATNSRLAESQNLFNKQLAENLGNSQSEIATINILIKTINDLSKPLSERNAAYIELKKIQPDIIAGVREENGLSQANIALINSNAKARKQLILLKAKEAAINAEINRNAAEQFKLELERPAIIRNLIKAQQLYDNTRKIGFDGTKNFGAALDNEAKALEIAKLAYKRNINPFNNLIEIQKQYTDQLDPIISSISEIDANTINLSNSTKDLTNSTEKEIKAMSDAQALRDAYLNSLKYINAEIIRGQKIQLDSKTIGGISPKGLDITPKIDFTKVIDINQASGIKIVTQKLAENTQKALDIVNKNAQESFKRTAEIINGVLFQPLEGLFTNLVETGKFAFRDFVNAILQQLTRLIAKLTAAAIVAGILAVLTGGGSTAGGAAAGGASSFGTIFKSLASLGGGIASPSFGGVNPGGMAMAGQVNLVLRGQDLVGSINRTNSQLSRIG